VPHPTLLLLINRANIHRRDSTVAWSVTYVYSWPDRNCRSQVIDRYLSALIS
jgi:hypothetical protein